MVLGHESSGKVVEVGVAVSHLKAGDRVAMEPGVPCRCCNQCRSGAYHLCGGMSFAATPPWDGTLAKYYVNTADFCYKVPDHMSMEEAAMVKPGQRSGCDRQDGRPPRSPDSACVRLRSDRCALSDGCEGAWRENHYRRRCGPVLVGGRQVLWC